MADLNKYISNGSDKVKLHEVRERVRQADAAELNELLVDADKELLALRTQSILQPLDNPLRIRHVRKLIARIQTELTARQGKEATA
jgi:large subunit ribosomal protein L29